MKKGKRHIIFAWIVITSFAAGQWAVYAHQHKTLSVKSWSSTTNHTKSSEKCQLCDAMHHNSMVKASEAHFAPILITSHVYPQEKYDFVSIALILSAGRSPPFA
ncbi:MAG TPA: hypothetical protein VHC47_13135 [Mucilaginibacter sp.]|nr:hypothetical protein [Mucilaginibacter sp.]